MKNLRNLTQSSLRNDPINRRMQGYSFRNFRRRRWSSRCKFALLFQSNFDLKHSLEEEMGQERSRTNGTRFGVLYKENLEINRESVLRREERFKQKTKSILNRWMSCWSRSTAPITRRLTNRRLLMMTVRSSIDAHDLISSRKEEGFDRRSSGILIQRSWCAWWVHRSHAIWAVITWAIDGHD